MIRPLRAASLVLAAALLTGDPLPAGARQAHAASPAPAYLAPVTRTVQTPNGARTYLLYAPNVATTAARPVLLAFHPGFGTDSGFAAVSALPHSPGALAAGMLLVYPQGINNTWDIDNGLCCGASAKVNEFAFVSAILADLAALGPIDRTRVYATGYSTGGQLVYDIACRDPGVLAGIAPVSAPMDTPSGQCTNKAPVPVFNVQGLQDGIVPYNGGQGTDLSAPPNLPIPQIIAYWAGIDSAKVSLTNEQFYSGQVTCALYSAPALASPAIQACTIPSMGHRWPGEPETAATDAADAAIASRVGSLGPYAPTLNMNEQLVAFLLAHHL